MLRANVHRRLGRLDLHAALEVAAGTTLVVAGESGAGKTTLLRLLAGLDTPDDGEIILDDQVLFQRGAGVVMPASRRPIGYVAQDFALFPHLSIFDNVAFGLRALGRAPADIRRRVPEVLGRLGIAALADQRPAQLSGGQAQRAALARALVLEPRLLLLDEPLSALDLQTRRTVRGELRDVLRGLTCVTVYVTHSPMEALVFGDRIVVMAAGQTEQSGTREDLLHRPRSPYVAELMGLNLFRGDIVHRGEDGLATIRSAGGDIAVVDPGGEGEVYVSVSPRDISLFLESPAGSARNVFQGRVAELIPEPPFGERVRVVLDTAPVLVAEVTRHAVAALGLREGSTVYASFKATGVEAYR